MDQPQASRTSPRHHRPALGITDQPQASWTSPGHHRPALGITDQPWASRTSPRQLGQPQAAVANQDFLAWAKAAATLIWQICCFM